MRDHWPMWSLSLRFLLRHVCDYAKVMKQTSHKAARERKKNSKCSSICSLWSWLSGDCARVAGVWDEMWKNVIVLVSISCLDFLSARLLCHCIFIFFFDTSETTGLFSFLCVVLRSTLRSSLVDHSCVEMVYFKPFQSWSMSKNFLWLNEDSLTKISRLTLRMTGPAVYMYVFCVLTEAKLHQRAVPTEPASVRNLQCFHTLSSLICLSQN